MDEHKISYLLT